MIPNMFSILALKITDVVEFTCMNQDKGCQVKLLKKELLVHEVDCLYTENIPCPLIYCKKKVSRYSILQHCTEQECVSVHEEKLVLGVAMSLKLDTDYWGIIPLCITIEDSEDKILILTDRLKVGGPLVFYVKLLSMDRNKKYPVELKVSNISGTFSRSYRGETASLEADVESVVEDANAAEISLAPLKKRYGADEEDEFAVEISLTVFST